jgi:aspartyl protease family protein
MADVPTLLIALATVAGGGTLLATHSGELPGPPPSAEQAIIAQAPPAATLLPSAHAPRRTVLQRQDDGLFYVDGMVNGAKVRFLIDTGSNMVVLSPQDAARAGVSAGESTGSLNTAAGPTSSAMTRIGRISVAGRDLRDVGATIPAAGLTVSLLGQNVLSELGELRIGRTTLTVG